MTGTKARTIRGRRPGAGKWHEAPRALPERVAISRRQKRILRRLQETVPKLFWQVEVCGERRFSASGYMVDDKVVGGVLLLVRLRERNGRWIAEWIHRPGGIELHTRWQTSYVRAARTLVHDVAQFAGLLQGIGQRVALTNTEGACGG